MHDLSIYTLLIVLLIVITTHSAPSSKSSVSHHLCPEEFRNLRRRQDDANADLDDDDDEDDDIDDLYETRENACEEAISMIVRHRYIAKLDPSVFLHFCPHYDQRLKLVQENNTLCENRKQMGKRKQHVDSGDSDDDVKRRALSGRELKKRFALRFIHKRMSSNLKNI